MANALPNAGFLELTDGWSASALLTQVVDEDGRGAAGRAVLVGSGTTSSTSTLYLRPTAARRAVVSAGATIEVSGLVSAFVSGAPVQPIVRVVFYNVGGTQVSSEPVGVAAAPMLAAHGEGIRGAAATFRRAFARFVVPPGAVAASAEYGVSPSAAGLGVEIRLLKPYAGLVPANRTEPMPWTPGIHLQADLQLASWPDILRPFQAGAGAEPRPGRIEFEAGPGRPNSRRSSFDPARRFNGSMRCDSVQREVLETFCRTGPGDFYIVEPDTDRLCVGSFAADGAPRMSESRGLTVMMDVGLWLETA